MTAERKLSTVSKILTLQVLIILVVSSGFYIAGGSSKALSPLLGGVAAFIPNLYFALRMARTAGQDAQKIVRSFYAGESGKLILTGILFVIIFQQPNIELLPLMTGYVAALSIFWFALILRD
ncbi:MAG: F0F1 ATP synthase assembly protein I [Methylococcaceae bacterium]|nr:F0F1 ATP synthase assembly protein I [Methylococcaceae bacterium]